MSNFAAQAERGLREWAASNSKRVPKGSENARWLAGIIQPAVHIQVPADGVIFDDGLVGMSGELVRLPYPLVTLEYSTTAGGGVGSSKNVIVVADMPEREEVYIFQTIHAGKHLGWMPNAAGWALPMKWDTPSEVTLLAPVGAGPLAGAPIEVIPEFLDQASREDLRRCLQCIRFAVMSVLSMCEALTCSNVTLETETEENPKTNVSRIKRGKLPIYSTKMLTIVAARNKKAIVSEACASNDKRSSPRQHLRRGHIRRLQNSNVWINSCTVGDPSKGRIDKTYKIEKERP